MSDVGSVEWRVLRLACFWQKHSQRVLVAVELQILSDQFVYDKVFIGQIRSVGRSVVQGTENLGSDLGPDLRQDSSLFERLLQYFFEFVDGSHFKNE